MLEQEIEIRNEEKEDQVRLKSVYMCSFFIYEQKLWIKTDDDIRIVCAEVSSRQRRSLSRNTMVTVPSKIVIRIEK